MKGPNLQALKNALQLFLRNLPEKCKFSILSFGNNASFNKIHGKTVIDMNEENLIEAIRMVQRFEATYGTKQGRNIVKALQMVFNPS